jgi:prepilin-type N-terminal cleavage/methylation domain-containing protein
MIKLNIYMKRYLSTFKKQAGFTLIELLVVIGILGILAAALIATIDPFEQLKKANDSNVKNTIVEFVNANIRYYTTHSAMPWGVDTDNCDMPDTSNLTDLEPCLNDLITEGELKSAFTTATNILTNITVFGDEQSVTACFLPTSKAVQKDLNTKYNADGTIGCDNSSNATNCYFCSL